MIQSRLQIGIWLFLFAILPASMATGLELSFLQRLQLPVSSDDIGYGHSVTSDPHTGEVFVCDPRSNRILIFDSEGMFNFQILGGIDFSNPRDLAVDPEGLIVVLANRESRSRPIELDFDGKFLRQIELYPDSDLLRTGRFTSIAMSPTGDTIYMADDANLRIWIVNRSGEVRGFVDLAAAESDETREDMIIGQIDIYGPNLLMAIPSEGEIRKYDLDGKLLDRVGIKGVGACKLGRPTAAALAKNGEYLIVDQQRMLLLHWSATGNQCLGEYIGIGDAPGYLYYPNDLSLDGEGLLYIAQSYDGRVQKYSGLPEAAGTSTDTRETDSPDTP